ncbi:hypothetical protein RSOLAG1IB_03253 [Rhizoctonia solani AG-1 IB]|uniref:BTB domain-containing protein n=1 Tax=Thanatephorus cucumeris (strain AG1-IB / isolate 7/3/14) TaxID=1108050 RepID=M5C729_THACB|nr:hypothetical protein BN14_05709 [Rhizoctonia solani AG-1 IB]CEL59320.1 hypothetical protein RSOLAG1IB_03253 [Rhizoctonia solani AG-1 IB]
MPCPAPNSSRTDVAESLFVPPSGGDLILRSRDDTDFLVHSTTLEFTSPVFGDMIASWDTETTIALPETASEVSCLLRFIYPNRLPLTTGSDAIPGCLEIVQKYKVGGAIEIIDELISINAPAHDILSSDPARAYRLSMEFGLVKTKAAAIPLVMAEGDDFCDLDQVEELTQKYSSLGLTCSMNIQAMRTKLLSDVLFRFDRAPIQPTEASSDVFYPLSCGSCQIGNRKVFRSIPPSWALAWLRLVYEALLVSSEPLEESGSLFQSTVLRKF